MLIRSWPIVFLIKSARRTNISTHVYHEIFLHFNWHTKDDSPILVPAVEQVVHNLLADRCRKSKGIFLHGIGGTETHDHLAISIEPQVTISERADVDERQAP